jgi:hypothetical protein
VPEELVRPVDEVDLQRRSLHTCMLSDTWRLRAFPNPRRAGAADEARSEEHACERAIRAGSPAAGVAQTLHRSTSYV